MEHFIAICPHYKNERDSFRQTYPMNTAIFRDRADLILYADADADPPLTGQQRRGGGCSHIHVLYGEVPWFSPPPLQSQSPALLGMVS